jgi:hypothetical protein
MQNTALRGVFSREEELQATITNMEAREKMYVEILKRASKSIGAFCSDEGWAQADMDTMDAVGATLNAKTNPFITSEWTARFVENWVRKNWPVDLRVTSYMANEYSIPEDTKLYAIPSKEIAK